MMRERRRLVYTLALDMSESMLNLNHRAHWRVRARVTKDVRARAFFQSRQIERPHRTLTAADLTVHIGWPDKRRRDAHNYMPVIKAAVDGFVDGAVVPDDSDTFLTGPDLRPHLAGHPNQAVLTFVFTERDPRPLGAL